MEYETVTFVCQQCHSDVKVQMADLTSFKQEVILDFIDWFGTWQTDKNLEDYGINDIQDAYNKHKQAKAVK